MCGIVGYIGPRTAQDILLNGLETLEYRGYDSAGIFAMNQTGDGELAKVKGRIADLRNHVDAEAMTDKTMGIGHTRWATHGSPTAENAHPHQSTSERFTLVHNGVIDNFNQLKTTYLDQVTFQSETDTEVIVQLIAYFAEEKGLATAEAFKETLKCLEGSYAVALIDREQPDTLFAAKHKSPLLLGVGADFNVISSDAIAMIKETSEFIELKDGELAELTREAIRIETLDGEVIQRDSFTADIDFSDLGKGTYAHYMLKEINEQPAVIRNLLSHYIAEDGSFKIDEQLLMQLQASDRIYIIAAGTSYHAGLVGKHLFEKIAGIPTEVHVASEFAYNPPLLANKPFFIYISQSGETADSRQVLVQTTEQGYPSLTITNVKGSTLSREADNTLLLQAGPEIAVASTKAYTAQIGLLSILAAAYRNYIGQEQIIDVQGELSLVATAMETVINDHDVFKAIAQASLAPHPRAFFIGRGLDYHVVLEAALKLKEISYIQTEGWASGELKHGTIALIEDDVPVISIITDQRTALLARSNAHEVLSRGATSLIIAMDGLDETEDAYVLPHVHETLTPLVSVIASQLLAYYTALELGNDIDKPRNLAKSVTVE